MTKRKTIMISICAVLLCICSLFTFLPINNCDVVKANTVRATNTDITSRNLANGLNMLSGTSSISSNLFRPYNVQDTSLLSIDDNGTIHVKGYLQSAIGGGPSKQLAIPAYDNNDSNIIIPANTPFTFSAYNYTGIGCRLMTFAGINMTTNERVADVMYMYGNDFTGPSLHKTLTYNYDLKIVNFMFYYYIPDSTETTTITFDFSINLSLYLGPAIDHYVPYSNNVITNNNIDLLYYMNNSIPYIDATANDFVRPITSDLYSTSIVNLSNTTTINLSDKYIFDRKFTYLGSEFMYSIIVRSNTNFLLNFDFNRKIISTSDINSKYIYDNFGFQTQIENNANKYSNGKYNYLLYGCSNGAMIGVIYYCDVPVINTGTYYYSTTINESYDDGYNNGYSYGYTQGNNDGYKKGNSEGYDRGYELGNNVGYNTGYSAGVASSSDYSFMSLISATIDAPIKYFQSLFNFDLLGVNLQSFITALFTLAVIITILKLVL